MQLHFPLNPTTGAEDATQLPWTNGVPSTGVEGSYPPFAAVVEPMTELANLIGLAGITGASSDLNQVTRAVRSGALDYAPDTGTADAAKVGVGLAHLSIRAGLPFSFVKIASPNATTTPSLTITDSTGNNGLTGTIVKKDGSALAAGDLPANSLVTVRADANGKFRVVALLLISDILALIAANAVVPATASPTLHVNPTTGNDTTGTGSTSAPFQTIAAAVLYGARRLNFAGYVLIIKLDVAGTYAAPGTLPIIAGSVLIQGDTTGTNQAGYVISGSGPPNGGLIGVSGGAVSLQGVTINNTGTTSNGVVVASGSLYLSYVSFTTSVTGTYALMNASTAGVITIGVGCIINGNAGTMLVAQGGNIVISANVAVPNNLQFSTVALALQCGVISFSASGLSFTGSGGSGGGSIGVRHSSLQGGIINTAGGGETAFPGNTTGTTASGGQYT